jgi:hypothetical protein
LISSLLVLKLGKLSYHGFEEPECICLNMSSIRRLDLVEEHRVYGDE